MPQIDPLANHVAHNRFQTMLGLMLHQTFGQFKRVRFDKLPHEISAHLAFAFVFGLRFDIRTHLCP